MKSAIEKWQATVVVLCVIGSVTFLAYMRQANIDTVIAGLFGISGLVLGAGAVAHGAAQGSKAVAEGVASGSQATANPPADPPAAD